MTGLHRHFTRTDLAATAEQLLADRRKGDPEAVKRNIYTPEKAAQRTRVAEAVADIMRAVVERRDPGDAELRWIESGGTDGASWHEIRTDLSTAFASARTTALQPGAPAAIEQLALRLGALASWFEPACPGGTTPLILFCASIEVQARSSARAAAQLRAPATPLPQGQHRELARAGGLFG